MADRVLIVEPYTTGHRGVWLKWMAEGLAARGWSVVISTLRESADHPTIRELSVATPAAELVANMSTSSASTYISKGALRREFAYRALLKSMYQQAIATRPHVVLVPYVDYCLHSIGLLGSPFEETPWTSITLRPSFHYENCGVLAPTPRFPKLREAAFAHLLRDKKLRACITIDQPLFDYWRQHHPTSRKLAYMPDPIAPIATPDKTGALKRFGLDGKKTIILLFGRIGNRKGLGHLLAAVQELAGSHPVCALLVGEQDDHAVRQLRSASASKLRATGNLVEFNGWVDDEITAAAFATSDIVWLGYENHWQSSGVQIQAAMTGKPVASTRQGIIGWQTVRNQCGVTFDIFDPTSIRQALAELISSAQLRQQLGANGRRYASLHTIENAVRLLDSRLRC